MTPHDRLLFLHLSNRLEWLAEQLAEDLREDTVAPMTQQCIVVANHDSSRWLSLQVATRSGLSMGLRFPFPRGMIDELTHALLGAEQRCSSCFGRTAMTWWFYDRLPHFLNEPHFAPVGHYLRDGAPLRRFELALRIAGLFDQYQIYRPDQLRGWESGLPGAASSAALPGEMWQSSLWRALRADFPDQISFVDLHAKIAALDDKQVAAAPLPERLRIFGVNSLPPAFLDILWKVAIRTRIDFYALSPTGDYWSDLLTQKQQLRSGDMADDIRSMPLAASLGRLGRDLLEQLTVRDFQQASERFDLGSEHTALGRLQADLCSLQDRSGHSPHLDDDSIEVHCCHSRMREVEVLHDRLLAAFERDSSLRARDVLIMAPDMNAYAPYIAAVFGAPESDATRIPYSIADQSARSQLAIIDAFLRLLKLATSRFTAIEVMATLESEPLRRHFKLTDTDLERIRRWLIDCGVVWAIDAEHRVRLGFTADPEYTFAHGTATLLDGYAMNGSGPRLHGSRLPYEDLEGDHLHTLERFLGAIDVLGALAVDIDRPRRRYDWAQSLTNLARRLFTDAPAGAGEFRSLTQTLDEFARTDPLADAADAAECVVPISVVLAFLETTLTQVPVNGGFLQGRVTFCSLKPMRVIPARVLGVLGLEDGAFPRRNAQLAFDLMAARPRRGDRSARDDDRYMFFETLLGARQTLYLSYVGQSLRNAEVSPPSSVVVEMLDYLGATEAVHQHALQAFSPRYFRPGVLQSFSLDNARAAELLRQGRAESRPFISAPLPEPDPALLSITPQELAAFLAHPARALCQRRLGLRLTLDDDVLPAQEPRVLDTLQRYGLQQLLLQETLHGDTGLAWPAAKARGKVPPGPLGAQTETTLRDLVDELVGQLQPMCTGRPRERVSIDITAAGCVVRGFLDDVYGDRLLRYRCATLQPKDRLQAWVLHVLLGTVRPEHRTVVFSSSDKPLQFASFANSTEALHILETLLRVYRRGLSEPLPLIVEMSWVAAKSLAKDPEDADAAMAAARSAWPPVQYGSNKSGSAPSEDPYNQLVHGAEPRVDRDFLQLATDVFAPLLARQEDALL
ncbi:MAG: exodeoxyribonuclease V subunit gamma [Sinobacteraceae bacterium]|nr:exodeoxyribonuclease V subunit gamma [Nevskiaceae bacterium]